ncbi:hypothetical protein [Oceaniovalibus sp. ACAM 378]|uniref:hypothetical protein n=1 Tax=Oceaniovalibus sp. ACAM 378 TaxID=2599923 RepID=UPI0011D47C43|nr:hypothetical protein [Oceaniovalibus sp. ACAM 378]TYB84226.1 hypothetical protein FQ320_22800 [Oceaniovalibus sp. ACAM 378]
MADREAEEDSKGKFKPGWFWTTVAFVLGLAASSVGIGEKVYAWCCAPPEDAPAIAASYIAMPLTLVDGEAESSEDLAVLAGFKVLRTDVLTEAIQDETDYSAVLLESINARLTAEQICPERGCVSEYKRYILGLVVKNHGHVPVQSGNLSVERFELDRTTREIFQFHYGYELIQDGCLYEYEGGDCVLEVGDVLPEHNDIALPDLGPGEAVVVPMAMIMTPDKQILDFWMHYLVGPATLPKSLRIEYGVGQDIEIEVREPLKSIYRLDFDAMIWGLG